MDYISISGYKSIKDERIALQPINILIGANGSGKSNFISFFDFLNRLYHRKLNNFIALKGGANKILHKGQKVSNKIEFKISFNDGANAYSCRLRPSGEGFIFIYEDLVYDDNNWNISQSEKEARVKISDVYRAKYVRRYLNGLRKYHFHDTGDNSPFTHLNHTQNDTHYLYSDGKNLAAFLYHIQATNTIVYNRIIKTIQSIAPYFSDFYFQPNQENYMALQWTDKYSDVVYGVNDLSDGTIRFIALTTLFLQVQLPDSIVIDEPELGLHPTAIAKLAGMIKSAAAKGCQVIVATQSTDLVSHFLPEDIITVDQVNGESKFKRLDSNELEEWMNDCKNESEKSSFQQMVEST